MLQEIPWNEVPIPESKTNVKFKQQDMNRQKKEARKKAKQFMKHE